MKRLSLALLVLMCVACAHSQPGTPQYSIYPVRVIDSAVTSIRSGVRGFFPYWTSAHVLAPSTLYYNGNVSTGDLIWFGSSYAPSTLRKFYFVDINNMGAVPATGFGRGYNGSEPVIDFTSSIRVVSPYYYYGSGAGLGGLNADSIINGTLSINRLPTSTVVPGTYTNTTLSVDAYGRITYATNGGGGAGTISGSGTAYYLPRFTGSTTLGNSILRDNGSNLLIDTGKGIVITRDGGSFPGIAFTRTGYNPVGIFATQFGGPYGVTLFVAPNLSVLGRISGYGPTIDSVNADNIKIGTLSPARFPVLTVTPGTYINPTITVDVYGRTVYATNGTSGGAIPDSQKVWITIKNGYISVGKGDTTLLAKALIFLSPYLTSIQTDTTLAIGLTAEADSAIARAIRFLTTTGVITATPAPGPLALVSPADISTSVSITPTLIWRELATAAKYWVQLSTTPYFASLTLNDSSKSSPTDTTISAGTLAYSSTYYWRARVRNTSGWSDWSQIWSFSTVAAINAIAENVKGSNSQASGTTLSVTLTIGSGTGANKYTVVAIGGASYSTATSVSDGTHSFTRIATRAVSYPSAELWGYKDIGTGSKTITATFANSTSAGMHVVVFNNVNQSTSIGSPVAAYGTGTSPTVGVTSAAGEVVIDCMTSDYATVTPQGTYTIVGSYDLLNGEEHWSTYRPGSGSTTVSYNLSQSMQWDLVAIALKPL